MTLYIYLTSVQDLPQSGFIFIQGSKAGLLSTRQVTSNDILKPQFLIKCASDDILTFKFAKNPQSYANNQIISMGSLHAQSLTKRYRAQLIGMPLNRQSMANPGSNILNPGSTIGGNPPSQIGTPGMIGTPNSPSAYMRTSHLTGGVLQYDIQLYTNTDKFAGVLHTTITYDPVSHFEGEFCSGLQRQRIQMRQRVALFKGKCPTKNLFSMLDPACDGQERKFIQSIYKDGDIQFKDY